LFSVTGIFEYSILSVAMLNKFLLALKHTTEVKEIILFGKKPCIAIKNRREKNAFYSADPCVKQRIPNMA
jgi:hypothetical protein